MNNRGYTLIEAVVTLALLSIVATSAMYLFSSGRLIWTLVDTQITTQENARALFQRLGQELQESGRDSSDTLQVWITDNGGVSSSDIMRFSIPLCLCGRNVMDETGEVRDWGAPLTWGTTGCTDTYTLTTQSKVTICHLPPGNPENKHTLDVAESAVKAHLAHGDYLGDCDACSTSSPTNKYIEYRMNSSGQIIRRVLDSGLNEIASATIAPNFTDFQTALSTGQNAVTVTANLQATTFLGRVITFTRTEKILLRNYE